MLQTVGSQFVVAEDYAMLPSIFFALHSVVLHTNTVYMTQAFMEGSYHPLLDAIMGLFGVSKDILFSSLITDF